MALTLALSPNIRSEAAGRTESQSPVWDRENTDLAALKIISEHPLTGVGWENFINVSRQYMRQQPDYPITGIGLEVHNVFFRTRPNWAYRAFCCGCWPLAALFGTPFTPSPGLERGRSGDARAPPEDWRWRDPWRMGGVAIVLCFLVIANLAPFSEALPNTLLWTWLGVLAMPYTSRLRCGVQPTPGSEPSSPSPRRRELAPLHLGATRREMGWVK